MASETGRETQRAAIILHGQGYDRVSYALSLASVALAMGMEVHLLATWGGLLRFRRGRLEDLGEETGAESREGLRRGLATGGIRPLGAQLAEAKTLGLRLYACPSAMANLNIARNELAPEVDQVMGLASFLELARGAAMHWYI